MDKIRVYELAKELNTTSKRLMEKLSEINIEVKNHMSLLEEQELKSLYKHIGVVKHDESKGMDDRKSVAPVTHTKQEVGKDIRKDNKNAPRIIRTTEIIVDSSNETQSQVVAGKSDYVRNDNRTDNRNNQRQNRRSDYVKVADTNSGLRAGFVRDTRMDTLNELKNTHNLEEKKDQHRENPRNENRPAFKAEEKLEQRQTNTQEIKKDNGEEKNTLNNSITKIQQKSESNNMSEETKVADVQKPQQDKSPEKMTAESKEKNIGAESRPVNHGQHESRNDSRPEVRKEDRINSGEQSQKSSPEERQGSRNWSNDRQQGGNRPQGGNYENRQGGYNRPQGGNYENRQGGNYDNRQGGNRPQGGNYENRQGGYNRPQGGNYENRQGGNYDNRQGGNRPQGGNYENRQGGYNRPQGGNYENRQGGNYDNRQGGNRPQGGNYENRQGGYNRPQGGNYENRQGGNYDNRQGGNRPQGGNYENRQGGYNRPQGGNYDNRQGGNYDNRQGGNRPQGGNYENRQGGYNRPQGGNYDNRQGGFRNAQKPLEIPKVEMSEAQKEEMNSMRSELRREFQNKDVDKDVKRDQKKEVPKTVAGGNKNERFKPHTVIIGQKKGVNEVLSEDFILNEFYSDDGLKKTRKTSKYRRDDRINRQPVQYKIAVLTSITIGETITVKELAESLKKTATEVIKKLMNLGIMATLNQELDFDTATIIADEFGIKVEKAVQVNEEDILFDDSEDVESELIPRPPVVVVMGHVDHGKTSLLDAIKETHVIDTEAGGITQHIGAYMVKINDRNITFLDTPGHEAFTAMRARGAQVTDIAILVVAADDGVMPQTIEAINHAKAANVSIIVAINKIDKPGANPDKVKQELTEYGIVAEEWGGDAIMVPVSAKKRENIDQLLEMVLLAADMLELKSNPNRQAKGTVIEAKLDKGRGPVATVLVQRGTLQTGDSIVTGTTVGRIRAMTDDKGQALKSAGPSTPVEILGLPEVPEAGEIFYAITDERVAKQLAEKRKLKQREQQLKASAKVSLEDLFTQIKEGKVKDLNIIVKADVQGSVEAVKQSLEKLSNEEVRVRILHGGVGAISEADVTLAQVSNAIIIGFNVRPGTNVADAAQDAGVDIRLYRVIYNAIEDVQAAMKGMLEPTFKEVIQGHAEIRQLFKVSGIGTIAGSYVIDGKIVRNSEIRVVRGGIVVHEGKLASLKRFKDDAKEVAQGYECGLSVEKFNDIKEGDIVESYIMEQVER